MICIAINSVATLTPPNIAFMVVKWSGQLLGRLNGPEPIKRAAPSAPFVGF
jgi:hypothetical protein